MLSKVKWSRDDFVRDENDDGMVLMNPKWKVLPSVSFVDSFTQVMTWKYHNNGSDYMMIHPCRWEHNLPAAQSDQNQREVRNHPITFILRIYNEYVILFISHTKV